MIFIFTLISIFTASASELRDSGAKTNPSKPAAEEQNCLATFKSIFDEQSKDGFFISNRAKLCRNMISDKAAFKTAADLKNQFDSDKQYKLHRLNQKELNVCLREGDHDLVAQYYYYLNRLDSGATATLEQIASIDQLLDKGAALSDISCGVGQLEKLTARCQELRSCKKNEPKLSQMAKETIDAEKELKRFDLVIGQLMNSRFKNKMSIRIPVGEDSEGQPVFATQEMTSQEMQAAYKDLLNRKFALKRRYEEAYPWMSGENYKKMRARDSSAKGVEEAIRTEEMKKRESLVRDLGTYQRTANCLNGSEVDKDKCNTKSILNTIHNAPELQNVLQFSENKDRQKNHKIAIADEYIEAAKCFDDAARDFKQTNQTLNAAALGFASIPLTAVAVAGLPAVTVGARTLLFSERLNLAARGASTLGAGAVAATSAAPLVKEAYEACSGQLESLQNTVNEPRKTGDYCPGAVTPLSEATAEYNTCINASLSLGLEALGFGGGGKLASQILKNRDNAKRIVDAEEKLKLQGKLTAKQKECIINAHNIGAGEMGADGKNKAAINNYRRDHNFKKGWTLLHCGFSRAQAQSLMDAGIVGNKPGGSLWGSVRELFKSDKTRWAEATDPFAEGISESQKNFRYALRDKSIGGDNRFISIDSDPNNPRSRRVMAKYLRTNEKGEIVVEVPQPDGQKQIVTLTPEQASTIDTSRTARDYYISPEERALHEKMKDLSHHDEFNEENRYISFELAGRGTRTSAKVIKTYIGGEVDVEVYEGGKLVKRTLSQEEFETARLSQSHAAKTRNTQVRDWNEQDMMDGVKPKSEIQAFRRAYSELKFDENNSHFSVTIDGVRKSVHAFKDKEGKIYFAQYDELGEKKPILLTDDQLRTARVSQSAKQDHENQIRIVQEREQAARDMVFRQKRDLQQQKFQSEFARYIPRNNNNELAFQQLGLRDTNYTREQLDAVIQQAEQRLDPKRWKYLDAATVEKERQQVVSQLRARAEEAMRQQEPLQRVTSAVNEFPNYKVGATADSRNLSLAHAYERLGLPPDASVDDVKKAYRRASSLLHEDKLKGLPEEYIKRAAERLSYLNQAKDAILKRK